MTNIKKWNRIEMTVAVENSGERLLTVRAAARVLNVSVRTVWRMIADGELHAVRMRRCTRLAVAEVLGYLEQSRQKGCG